MGVVTDGVSINEMLGVVSESVVRRISTWQLTNPPRPMVWVFQGRCHLATSWDSSGRKTLHMSEVKSVSYREIAC